MNEGGSRKGRDAYGGRQKQWDAAGEKKVEGRAAADRRRQQKEPLLAEEGSFRNSPAPREGGGERERESTIKKVK